MDSSTGPKRFPADRQIAGPIVKRKPPQKAPQGSGSEVPLRRPDRPAEPAGLFWGVTPAAVEQALAAVAQGDGTDLPTRGSLRIRLASTVREVIQKSRLDPGGLEFLERDLAAVLGSPEAVAALAPWRERPDFKIYQTAFRRPDAGYVFTFVVVPRQDEGMIVVAACEYQRIRHH
jgi:hypothetical protein